MKIALFTVHNLLACHYSLFGYRETLERMGHEVLDCSFPGNNVENVSVVAAKMPTIEQLMTCDLVLSTYHEYTHPWLSRIYTFKEWTALMQKVPVLARYDESMDRGDLHLPHRMPELQRWATHYSFPAVQDAEKYGGEWLPYGADTSIFYPDAGEPKKYDLAFIGTLYPKRHEYLMKLAMHTRNSVNFYAGNVIVQDLEGVSERDTTERLALNYRRIKIFFCLPPMSRLLVEKIFDIMACNTMVMYPRFPDDAAKNCSIFENGKHIVYYDLGYFANNGTQIKYYVEHPEEVQRIAEAGGELVRSKYTLERMMERMLEQCASLRSTASLSK
jgi:glycosyltransferase involved in cell wall biosynthesis